MDASLFETLADPTRRRIVQELLDGEHAVNDLVEAVDVAQSGVSRHLRILHEAGVVKVRPQGKQRMYSLEPAPFQQLDSWMAPYRALWEARLDRLEAHVKRMQGGRRP